MNKFQNITNPEFLTELEQRLANFTESDFITLVSLLSKHQSEFFKAVEAISPQAHQWTQAKIQEYEQEKTDQEAEDLKKSLENK